MLNAPVQLIVLDLFIIKHSSQIFDSTLSLFSVPKFWRAGAEVPTCERPCFRCLR